MRQIVIALPDTLFTELQAASAGSRECGFTPAMWAQEAVESALATRRLPSVPVGSHGAHKRRGQAAPGGDAEPGGYPVRFPDPMDSYDDAAIDAR